MRGGPRLSAAGRLTALLAVLGGLLVAAPGAFASGPASIARVTDKTTAKQHVLATITRDRAGIPHIVAKNFTALGEAEGYVFAADNLCTLANDVVTIEGERSRYFGPTNQAVNYSAGVADPNLSSDLYWRYVKTSGIVRRYLHGSGLNALLPQVRDAYAGFATGYNRYLKSGKLRDPACKGKPWVRPITMTDLLLRGVQIATEASAAQFISGFVGAVPPGAAAPARVHATRGTGLDLAALKAQFSPPDPSQGSNGIGLGAQDTRAHHGMVLANPHFPWRGTERFWMAQLEVPGQYNVEGGTLAGFPLIGIGFNRHMAWTHTVSTSRRFVAYQLNLVPGAPTSYYLDGVPTKMGQSTVSVRYGATTVRHTFYTTHWGMVATIKAAHYGWDTTHAYALYDAEINNGPRTADQYLRMGQATSVHGLYNAEAKYLAIPTFNTVAADDHGNAYYGDVGATPAVSLDEINTCTPAGAPLLVYRAARVITLDGSKTSCAPANYAGTPEAGVFPARRLPHTFRRDYVENSNDSYWLANPSHPLTGFSPIIGLTDTVQGLRTRLGNEMIAQRVAGTDGLGAPKFTIATLQRMWEGDRSGAAENVLKDLVAQCRANPTQTASNGQTVDLTAACDALAAYKGTGRLNDTGGWLFYIWYGLDTDSNFWAVPFDATKPLTTPTGLNPGTAASPAAPLKWLADAVLSLQAHNLPVRATYGQVQYAPQSRRIPIPGCSVGCFNAIYSSTGPSTNPVNAAPYGQVYDGSSLVMTTQLNPSGPQSQGILTYSQASDPTSPWYRNMTRLYSQSRWVPLAYTAKQLRAGHPSSELVLVSR